MGAGKGIVARLIYGFNRSGSQLSDGAMGFVFPLSIPVCPIRSRSIPPDQTMCNLGSAQWSDRQVSHRQVPPGAPDHGIDEDGCTQFLADKITNHTDRSIGAVYNRYEYEAEKRDALTLWDAKAGGDSRLRS